MCFSCLILGLLLSLYFLKKGLLTHLRAPGFKLYETIYIKFFVIKTLET